MRSRSSHGESARPAEIRCAIYTRKSSEEGLEQEFNSLHAQREACQAYILSQRHEGWRALPTLYDDGGVSGGTMLRPALQRLLEDIRHRRVDLVVIYKVDRLTRSLADFAKLVDVFNAHQASFVSVTQQFNTATSMGRLTLNMLLSFAQFEREVTGERIRDKIAASKRKGMWMGGYPPLGYDVLDRKLVINEREAAQVRRIFDLYLEVGSVRLVRDRLAEEGITSKVRQSTLGVTTGGRPLLRGNIYEMLRNRLYRGEIAHKGHVYAGEHQPIIDAPLWESVQSRLNESGVERATRSKALHPSLLSGLVYDAAGEGLTSSHAKKGAKRYRYYVSRKLVIEAAKSVPGGLRLPAGELEAVIVRALRDLLDAPTSVLNALRDALPGVAEQHQLLSAARCLADTWDDLEPGRAAATVRKMISRVSVHADRIEISLSQAGIAAVLLPNNALAIAGLSTPDYRTPVVVNIAAALRRVGQEMKLVVEGTPTTRQSDPSLARLLHQAIQFREQFLSRHDAGIAALAEEAGVSGSHFTRVMRLGFLAPDVIAAIADGQHPVHLNATKLAAETRLPLLWDDQRRMLGFPPLA